MGYGVFETNFGYYVIISTKNKFNLLQNFKKKIACPKKYQPSNDFIHYEQK